MNCISQNAPWKIIEKEKLDNMKLICDNIRNV